MPRRSRSPRGNVHVGEDDVGDGPCAISENVQCGWDSGLMDQGVGRRDGWKCYMLFEHCSEYVKPNLRHERGQIGLVSWHELKPINASRNHTFTTTFPAAVSFDAASNALSASSHSNTSAICGFRCRFSMNLHISSNMSLLPAPS